MKSLSCFARRLSILLFTVIVLLITSACGISTKDISRGETTSPSDYFGDYAEKIVYLDQGWNARESEWFYTTTQGSNLMSYWLFLHLEDVDSTWDAPVLFRNEKNIRLFRYLPQNATKNNPDALPVGFVKDRFQGEDYIGMTCAACHTTQINFKGIGIRVDGGPALADMVKFLTRLEAALASTLKSEQKIQRLAAKVNKSKDEVLVQVAKDFQSIEHYNRLNKPVNHGVDIEYGYARLDAFGRIYNRLINHLGSEPAKQLNSPNAPVSYPFLWDAPYLDFVQWNGIADNGSDSFGPQRAPLGRNVGQVLGVFASFSLEPGQQKYVASANKINLEKLERRLQDLWSPSWNDAAAKTGLKPINRTLAEQGKLVYEQYQCGVCHQTLDLEQRKQRTRRIITQFTSPQFLGTDPAMQINALSYCGDVGYLVNDDAGMCAPPNQNQVPGATALAHTVKKVIEKGDPEESIFRRILHSMESLVSDTEKNPIKETKRHIDLEISNKSNLLNYKARSLNGVWATAPYLHNGSIPNLYELFLPACQNLKAVNAQPGINCRSLTFTVGSRELDQEKVGFVSRSKEKFSGLFEYDTGLPGNSNLGHEYAAGVTPMIKTVNGKVVRDDSGNIETFRFEPINEQQRRALVEYVKSL